MHCWGRTIQKIWGQPHISSLVFIVFVRTSACGRCQKNANFCVLDQILIAPISYSASKYCWYITTIKHWPTIRRSITCMWKRFVKLLLESALEQLLLLKKVQTNFLHGWHFITRWLPNNELLLIMSWSCEFLKRNIGHWDCVKTVFAKLGLIRKPQIRI